MSGSKSLTQTINFQQKKCTTQCRGKSRKACTSHTDLYTCQQISQQKLAKREIPRVYLSRPNLYVHFFHGRHTQFFPKIRKFKLNSFANFLEVNYFFLFPSNTWNEKFRLIFKKNIEGQTLYCNTIIGFVKIFFTRPDSCMKMTKIYRIITNDYKKNQK